MTRAQIFILAILAVLVCIVFGAAAVMLRAALVSPTAIAEEPATAAPGTSVATPTWTPNPTWTPSPTPTPVDTLPPTPTNTRVVLDTATPTPSSTPTVTPTPSITPTPTPARGSSGSSGGAGGGARPTPQPTSRYPLKIVEGPLTYETKNFIFVVYARISSGGTLLPGYRMVGTHSPSGANIRSVPSCNYLCKGSGPRREKYFIQEGNLAFEAFFYDTGTWSLMLIDPQGQQASEILKIDIDRTKRVWYYYHFNR